MLARAFLTRQRRKTSLVPLSVAQERFGGTSASSFAEGEAPVSPSKRQPEKKAKGDRPARLLRRLSSVLMGPFSSEGMAALSAMQTGDLLATGDGQHASLQASSRAETATTPTSAAAVAAAEEGATSFPGVRLHRQETGLVSVQLSHAERKALRAKKKMKKLRAQHKQLQTRMADLRFENTHLRIELDQSKAAVQFFREKTGAVREDLVLLHGEQMELLRSSFEAQIAEQRAIGAQQQDRLARAEQKCSRLKSKASHHASQLNAAHEREKQLLGRITLLEQHPTASSPDRHQIPQQPVENTADLQQQQPVPSDVGSVVDDGSRLPKSDATLDTQPPSPPAAASPSSSLPLFDMPSPIRGKRMNLMAEIQEANIKLTQVSATWFAKKAEQQKDGDMADVIARALIKRRLCMTDSKNSARPAATPLRAALLGTRGGHYSDHDSESDWEG